ncbi:MAG: hypothetical protein KJO77_00395 [Bacteroidia bacterium]|nr:hypothetical protein [Bacteroidia bacterium]NND51821.1 hypothetical protein [Flavobacteriaceae bacterium]
MKYLLSLLAIIFCFQISQAQDSNTCNCCTEVHAEFDFWIGNWTVTNPDGSAAGKNVIDKIQDNCILRENWTSARPGYTGTSHNFYNSRTKQWEQIWVDNQGQSLHLKGHRKGNKMILKTDKETNKDGQVFYHRVTWTSNEDGTVRQLWETITDGKDVSIAFDGLYKKE